jgi:adenylate cyclase
MPELRPGGATIDTLRFALEGVIPPVIATCSPDGTPNVTYVSQMHYIDPRHVALTFQFFNKTRENVLANPQVTAIVINPVTAAVHRIGLLYQHTEESGPIFETMKARLAGIASHTGMAGVFRLRGADIYRVLSVTRVAGGELPALPETLNRLAALRCAAHRLGECIDLGGLLDQTLAVLEEEFGIEHALILMADEGAQRLYTVASRGYPMTGVGSEIEFGEGVIGVAAQHRTPIRINHMTLDYAYGRAMRDSAREDGLAIETEIPFPGLAEPHSQLAVPIMGGGRLVGVLCVESMQDMRFSYDDEDALVTLAGQLGLAIRQLHAVAEAALAATAAPAPKAREPDGLPLLVRHHRQTKSVFLDEEYLIKGVAGAILWKLLRAYAEEGRSEFSNRELRIDAALGLPELDDNLEARLILLQRRLKERSDSLALEKTGRGQFRLAVRRPVRLMEENI